jgi:hypothetical protein
MAVVPKWYYSGGASNNNPEISYGGAKSSVELSGTALNNLFDDSSGEEALAGRTEYRCLYVQNTGATTWVDPVMWIPAADQPHDPNTPFTLSGETIDFAMSSQGKNAAATSTGNVTAAPSGPSFAHPATKGAGTALTTPDYATNDYIGVWFKRIVPAEQPYSAGTIFSALIEGDDA